MSGDISHKVNILIVRGAALFSVIAVFFFTRYADANLTDSLIILCVFALPIIALWTVIEQRIRRNYKIRIESEAELALFLEISPGPTLGSHLQEMLMTPQGLKVSGKAPFIASDFWAFYRYALLGFLTFESLWFNILGHPFVSRYGRRTWGCIIVSNDVLDEPGLIPAPALIVYSDREPCIHLSELEKAAMTLGMISTSDAVPKDRFTRNLKDHMHRQFGTAVPQYIGYGDGLKISTLLVRRSFLPENCLTGEILPICIGVGGIVTIIHHEEWPQTMKDYWSYSAMASSQV